MLPFAICLVLRLFLYSPFAHPGDFNRKVLSQCPLRTNSDISVYAQMPPSFSLAIISGVLLLRFRRYKPMIFLYREGWRIGFSRAVSVVFPLTSPTIRIATSSPWICVSSTFAVRVTFHPCHLQLRISCRELFPFSSPLRMLTIFRVVAYFSSSIVAL
jgi:hypothetical protein